MGVYNYKSYLSIPGKLFIEKGVYWFKSPISDFFKKVAPFLFSKQKERNLEDVNYIFKRETLILKRVFYFFDKSERRDKRLFIKSACADAIVEDIKNQGFNIATSEPGINEFDCKRGLFIKSKFNILDDKIICHAHLLTTRRKRIIDLNEIDYIILRKGKILGYYLLFGTFSGDIHKILMTEETAKNVFDICKAGNYPFIDNLAKTVDIEGQKDQLLDRQLVLLQKNHIIKGDGFVYYIPDRKNGNVGTRLDAEEIIFYTTQPKKNLWIFPGKKGQIYFGGRSEQIYFEFRDKGQIDEIKEHIISHNAPIGQEADKSFADTFWLGKLLRPMKFFHHEEIGLTDDAIIYKYRKGKGKKQDNIYLPFDKITFVSLKKGWLHSNSIIIFGEQNIETKLQFSNSVISLLKETIKKEEAREVRPTMWFGLLPKPFAKQLLYILYSGTLVYWDKKKKRTHHIPYENVTDIAWKKKHWYYLIGYLFIAGDSVENIREDQDNKNSSLDVKIPRIFFTTKNKIRNIYGHAKYNDKEYKKGCYI